MKTRTVADLDGGSFEIAAAAPIPAVKLPEPYWQSPDGEHTLYHGDCIELLPLMEPGSVDCLIADPPYAIENKFGSNTFEANVGGSGGTRIMQFDWDIEATSERIAAAFALSIRALKKSAAVFCFVGFDSARAYSDPFREARFTVKPAAWVKACPCPPGKGNWWPSAFDLAFYGYRKSPYFGDCNPTRNNIFVADSYRFGQPGKVDHPTQKPLGLIQRIVSAICPPDGTAIDPTSGSGTTAVACIRTGRKSISIEKELKYCQIAKRRMEEAIGIGTLFDPKAIAPDLFAEIDNTSRL